MRSLLYLPALLAPPALAAGLHPVADLQAAVERFAGAPALVDPRLILPACAAPDFAWGPRGQSVQVHCGAPEWRVFVALGGDGRLPQTAPQSPAPGLTTPLIRRGDRVVVEAGGEGFVVGLDAVAEADSRDGRVALRASGGGRRLIGLISEDGAVRINGLNAVVNRR